MAPANDRCEVAIVGGGFAGLSAAYHLAREGRDVVLLEAGEIGQEASGKNTGMLGPGVQGPITALVKKHGREEARRVFRATLDAVDAVVALVGAEKLACDIERNGQLLVARTERQARALREQARTFEELGFDVPLLDAGETRRRIGSPLYRAGLVFEGAANLDPRRLCAELARAARERGARVGSGARVLRVEPGKPARLQVGSFDLIKSNHLTADHVVLATNAFTPRLGFLRGRVVPLVTHVLATEPLDAEQVASLSWPGREGVVEARRIFHYLRLDAANRLLFGGGATTREDPREWRALERELLLVFPALRGVAIERRWSGTMGFTLDMLPIVGELLEAPGVLHAGAWCGHGVALSIASGARIADLVAQRTRGRLPWHRGSAPWLPPDPLRAAGIQAYLSAQRTADRIEEGATS